MHKRARVTKIPSTRKQRQALLLMRVSRNKEKRRRRNRNTHIRKVHQETRTQRLRRPYCTSSFCNRGNANVHFDKKRCANEPHGRQNERWADIGNANRRNEEKGRSRRKKTTKQHLRKNGKISGANHSGKCRGWS